ncbi:MAG: hypothetical protein HFI53_06290 [Lachnospiraceae bacterium]|nr:hypothetical protein [Lachnospiraceae bacterium]
MRRKIDPTLLELCMGIAAYGIIFEIVLLFFSRNPVYSAGLWIGIILALAGAVHMWWSLNRGLDLPQKAAVKSMSTQNIIRYVTIAAVLAVLMCTDFANPIFAFCGYMGMKVSAYLNPLIHRLRTGKEKQEEEISDGTAL